MLSCSANSLSHKYNTFKQNAIYSIANFIGDIAYVNYSAGDYSNAIDGYECQINLLDILLTEQIDTCKITTYQTEYVLSLSYLGILYSATCEFRGAEQCYLKALDICEAIFTKHHPNYVNLLCNLGGLYSDIGNYKDSEGFYLKALEIQKSIVGTMHPDYAMFLNHLGTFYYKIGNYIKSESYLLQALDIYKLDLRNSKVDHACCLHNLGALYLGIDDYMKAEKYLLESLNIKKEILEHTHLDYAYTLNSLGSLYLKTGDYLRAEKYYLEALNIRKSTLGVNHPEYATILHNLGSLYVEMENYKIAESYISESMDINRMVLGSNHPEYAADVNSLGAFYFHIGEYGKAENCYLEALSIRESILGSDHPDCANSLSGLGTLYTTIGNYVKAEKYFLKALNIRKSTLGVNHSDYAISLNNLGTLYITLIDYNSAYLPLMQSFNIQKSLFLSSLNYTTEQDRNLYWKTMQSKFDETYPIFAYRYHFSKPSISTFAYDNELFRKGLLLSSSNSIRQSILESHNSILIEQWNELVGTKQVIMNLEEKDPNSTNLVHYKNQADSLEKIVTKSSAIFRETKQQQSITWDSIQQYLTPDEVAIEYFIAPLNEDSTMYCALLLRHDSQYPELIPLCEEKEIVNCLSQNRTNDIYTFDTNSKTIFNLIWDKILPQIHEGETIYFSPAGLLHQIAIENIPYDKTHTMSDVYTMVRLSSTREIVKKDKSIKHHTATIYGGIFYDVDKTSLLAESRNYDTEDMFASRSISSTLPNRGSVLYLPGTKKEAESIHSLLNSNNITSTLYTASKANEESFKSLSGKHRNILHIGTHGFYWEDSTARKQDYFSQRIQLQMLGDNQLQKPSIDPLIRCGLLFAGSNIALSGHSNDLPEGVQDGILTAKEISLMDLRDADLVVLSACETAKGNITSEGIFGLQRAFKMAGVQTIIMSLWKVNDQATQMLMTEFYTNWISKNQSKREAFKNAQNTVRAKFEEPEYWAGFILLD